MFLLINSLTLADWTLNEPQAVGRQRTNSQTQISSSCPQWESKWLFSWHTCCFPSLPPPSLLEAGAFSSQVHWAVGHTRPCLLFLLPSSVHFSRSLTHTAATRVSCLILSTTSLSPGEGHQPIGAICLHVMEVWGCGARLRTSRLGGEGQTRQMPKHSTLYVCVC